MKKQIFRYLSGIVPAIAMFTSVNAQDDSNSQEPLAAAKLQYEMPAQRVSDGETNVSEATTRALNNFNKVFKNTGNANWYALKHGMLVKFEDGGIKTKVFYNSKGKLVATLRTYGGDKLPKEIRKQVGQAYYGYNIFVVNELEVADKTAYLVSIADEENVKTIRITAEEMDIYEEFKKIQ